MPEILELLPNEKGVSRPVFKADNEYDEFREWFTEGVKRSWTSYEKSAA